MCFGTFWQHNCNFALCFGTPRSMICESSIFWKTDVYRSAPAAALLEMGCAKRRYRCVFHNMRFRKLSLFVTFGWPGHPKPCDKRTFHKMPFAKYCYLQHLANQGPKTIRHSCVLECDSLEWQLCANLERQILKQIFGRISKHPVRKLQARPQTSLWESLYEHL